MLFYSGQAAHIVQTNSFVANCKSEQPDFYENNLGLFNYPVIEGGKGQGGRDSRRRQRIFHRCVL